MLLINSHIITDEDNMPEENQLRRYLLRTPTGACGGDAVACGEGTGRSLLPAPLPTPALPPRDAPVLTWSKGQNGTVGLPPPCSPSWKSGLCPSPANVQPD